MKELTDIEKAYFAGLFDGEGCVEIKENRNKFYILNVHFKITYENILKEMKKYFYGSIHKLDMNKIENSPSAKAQKAASVTTRKWKQQYLYQLNSRDAWLFLKVIAPFCKEKKSQVELAISYYQGKKLWSTSLHEIERSKFYRAELQRMKQLESDNMSDTDIIDFEDDQQSLSCFFNEEQ